MYQYIPGMYQYMPSIRTEIHTKIHTNTEGWYWYVSVRIKFQYVHYTSLMGRRTGSRSSIFSDDPIATVKIGPSVPLNIKTVST